MPGMPAGRRLAFMTRVGVLLVAALAFAMPAASCGFGGSERVGGERAAKPRVLTMLNPFTSSDELTAFADEVERLSNGALRIRIIHRPRQPTRLRGCNDQGRAARPGRSRHGCQSRVETSSASAACAPCMRRC